MIWFWGWVWSSDEFFLLIIWEEDSGVLIFSVCIFVCLWEINVFLFVCFLFFLLFCGIFDEEGLLMICIFFLFFFGLIVLIGMFFIVFLSGLLFILLRFLSVFWELLVLLNFILYVFFITSVVWLNIRYVLDFNE